VTLYVYGPRIPDRRTTGELPSPGLLIWRVTFNNAPPRLLKSHIFNKVTDTQYYKTLK